MRIDPRIIKNLIFLLGVQGVNYVFPLLTVAIVARALEVEYLGFLIIAQVIAMYVQQATDFGFNLTATRRTALCYGRFDELSKVFTSTILAKCIVFIAATVILYIASLLFDGIARSFELVCILLVGVFSSIFYPIWLFQGIEKMQNIFIGNFITKASSLFLMFLLVDSPGDLYLAAFIQSISWLLVGIYSLIVIRVYSYCTFQKINVLDVIGILKESSYIYFSVLATSFYTMFNILLLDSFASSVVVAMYGIADKLRVAAQSFIGVFAQALYPHFCARAGNDRVAFWMSLILGSVSGLAFYLLAPVAILLLSGDTYEEAVVLAQLFALLCPIIALSNYYSKLKIAAQGYQKLFLKVYSLGALLHLSYVYFFIEAYSTVGLTVSVILTETLIAIFMFFGARTINKSIS